MRGGYSIVVNGLTPPLWMDIVSELARKAPELFDGGELRTFPSNEVAILDYAGVRVWLYGSGMVRIAPASGTADRLLREIGARMGLETGRYNLDGPADD